jgi:tRNA U34 2-thiouridine synthase MnmA/TrmU
VIDSSVADALLKNEGYEVFCLTMQVTNSEEVAKAARDAAQALVIPSDQVDLRGIFGEKIIAEFCRQY